MLNLVDNEHELFLDFCQHQWHRTCDVLDEFGGSTRELENLVRSYMHPVHTSAEMLTSRWGQMRQMEGFRMSLDGWQIEGWRGRHDLGERIFEPAFHLKIAQDENEFAWFAGFLSDYSLDIDHCRIRCDRLESLRDACKKLVDEFDDLTSKAEPMPIG